MDYTVMKVLIVHPIDHFSSTDVLHGHGVLSGGPAQGAPGA